MNCNNHSRAENNRAELVGELLTDFHYAYENLAGKRFFQADLKADRLSGVSDIIPLTIPEEMANQKRLPKGSMVCVKGQFRSYNHHEGEKHRLLLAVWVQELEEAQQEPSARDNNQIILKGYLCKTPFYRKTPLGREITDLLLAVNRPYGKSDYIPCICWEETARFAAGLSVGEPVQIAGRLQSREYLKRTGGKRMPEADRL